MTLEATRTTTTQLGEPAGPSTTGAHALAAGDGGPEPRSARIGQKLNWLRAGVLGANDGIVSVAGVVIGVAAATPGNTVAVATAGVAALVAGAFSMAGGEYVSVSTQRDTEKALIDQKRRSLAEQPAVELRGLAGFYRRRGVSAALATQVAEELSAHDALAAHAEVELGIDPDEYTSPWAAAISSFVAFTIGGLLPLIMILLPLGAGRIPAAGVAVLVGLVLTGWISAALGEAPRTRAVLRNVLMGGATMIATYLIGLLFGVAVG
ncbi:MAG: VIT family protein [Leucobacter sp.]|nr:VIT family protein [Leucobacter sp.]